MPNQRLPGFLFTYRDGGLTPAVIVPSTERLLIIGTALDGPVNRKQTIRNLSEAEEVFGPLVYKDAYLNPVNGMADGAYTHNSLLKAIHEALIGGAGDIICARVGGTLATSTTTFSGSVNVFAKNPGRVYNNVTLAIASGATYTFTLTQPTSKGGTVTFTFAASSLLRNALTTINRDGRNRTIVLTLAAASVNNTVGSVFPAVATLSGGTNGTDAPGEDYFSSKTNYYTALTQTNGAFDNLIDAEFDISYLTGIYADDQVNDGAGATTSSAAIDFAEFNFLCSKETRPCHGIIGLRPTGLDTMASLTDYATNSLLATSPDYYDQTRRWIKFGSFMYNGFFGADPNTGEQVDLGRFISVVAGPDVLLSQREIGYYIENGAGIYAGMITKLPSQSATTNKSLGVAKSLTGTFPKSILEQLNQGIGYDVQTRYLGSSAYVTMKTSQITGRPTVVSDNTCAQRDSDYATLQILRICNLASRMVKAVMHPFIGEAFNVEARTAMRTQLTTELNKLVDSGALLGGDGNGYKFAISADPVENAIGQITITLQLRPAIQLKWIDVVVNVTQ